MHPQRPTHEFGALSHRQHPVSVPGGGRIEPDAGVGHLKPRHPVTDGEGDGGHQRTGMLDNVLHTLLGDAVQRHLDVLGQPPVLQCQFQVDLGC